MLGVAAAGTDPAPGAATSPREITLSAATTNPSAAGTHCFAFCPTWRWLVPNNASYPAYRTSTRCFLRGISEKMALTPNDSTVWYHRRVVAGLKSELGTTLGLRNAIGAQESATATSYRQLRDFTGETSGGYQATWDVIQATLFQGIKTVDWQDDMTARVDRARWDVYTDYRYAIRSGNQTPNPKFPKFWTTINKTIQYDDEENGISMTPNPQSVTNKIGCGNIYVFDFFEAPIPVSTVTSTLRIDTQMTMYWNEK